MKSYKSFSAGVATQNASEATYMYTVPSGCSQAKLTFISGNYTGRLCIKKNGSEDIIGLATINDFALALSDSVPSASPNVNFNSANVSKTGIYLDPGDSLYALDRYAGVTFFVSGMLEYDN